MGPYPVKSYSGMLATARFDAQHPKSQMQRQRQLTERNYVRHCNSTEILGEKHKKISLVESMKTHENHKLSAMPAASGRADVQQSDAYCSVGLIARGWGTRRGDAQTMLHMMWVGSLKRGEGEARCALSNRFDMIRYRGSLVVLGWV